MGDDVADAPPAQGVGASQASPTATRIDETLASEFGALRSDACWLAYAGGKPAGAILVVERSIWDDPLDGPFIVDLFVHPEARGLGLGHLLVMAAMGACTSAGDCLCGSKKALLPLHTLCTGVSAS